MTEPPDQRGKPELHVSGLAHHQTLEATEDAGRNPSSNPTLSAIVARREVLKGALSISLAATLGISPQANADTVASRFRFPEVPAVGDHDHHVAAGYRADILIRWGDPVLPSAGPFNFANVTADAQRTHFGYNNDFIGYVPIPGASDPSRHGLLVINHEFTNTELMVLDYESRSDSEAITELEMSAHGGTVIEVKRISGLWQAVDGSPYARRIDAATPMQISGPAAGHERLRTSADPTGANVLGMINNCGGGVTPWGTWLSCEENFHGYFSGEIPATGSREARNFERYGIPGEWFSWAKWQERFDLSREPNEPNRFGWVVEIDPFDASSVPKKRTALGRFKHEAAFIVTNNDGRIVVYSGDDERFEYIYRFVSARQFDPYDRAANTDLLDDGTLSVARYNADGTLDWLPLVHGHGPLNAENGFCSQADVLIEARCAGDLLGATKMDRPEDVEVSPVTQKIYVTLTNNAWRTSAQLDAANPRPENRFGHIIEMVPPDGDHTSDRYRWELFLSCGDPRIATIGATFSPKTTGAGWFGMPDNLVFDAQGRLWVATDGNSLARTGRADGLWGVETEGSHRGVSRHFYSVPVGAELCGPAFTPDGETLFVAVQHPPSPVPASGNFPPSWPDFQTGVPPRPSIVVITKRGGGVIGTS